MSIAEKGDAMKSDVTIKANAVIFVLALFWAAAAPAYALTTEQVIRLRKAGVSNKTIEMMLDAETNSRMRGYAGRYVVKQESGKEVIVYEASTSEGIVEYPTIAAQEAGGVEKISTVLGFPARVQAEDGVVTKTRGHTVSQALPAGGYTVHITSYKNRKYAQREAALLKSLGLDASVSEVNLKDKGVMHRVSVGSFKSSKAAKAFGQKLKSGGKVKSFWVGKR